MSKEVLYIVLTLSIVLAAPAVSQEPPDTAVAPLVAPLEIDPDTTYETRSGFAACLDHDRFLVMMEAVARGDSETFRRLVETPRETGCFMLNGSLRVRVVTNHTTYLELDPEALDLTIWTVIEAIAPLPSGG